MKNSFAYPALFICTLVLHACDKQTETPPNTKAAKNTEEPLASIKNAKPLKTPARPKLIKEPVKLNLQMPKLEFIYTEDDANDFFEPQSSETKIIKEVLNRSEKEDSIRISGEIFMDEESDFDQEEKSIIQQINGAELDLEIKFN